MKDDNYEIYICTQCTNECYKVIHVDELNQSSLCIINGKYDAKWELLQEDEDE